MTDPLFDLAGRVAVVTGGYGPARLDATCGAVGARDACRDRRHRDDRRPRSRRPVRCAGLRRRPRVRGGRHRSGGDRARASADVADAWDVPHLLVNNAAVDAPPDAPAEEVGPFESYPVEALDRVLDVNVTGTVVPCQVVGAAMARAGRGSIVNVSSIYGMLSPDQSLYDFRREAARSSSSRSAYSVSKSAILNLTRYLATYWAKARRARQHADARTGWRTTSLDEFVAAFAARSPLGRMTEADEAVGAVVFLASDASSYVTGANVVVDGGWSAW